MSNTPTREARPDIVAQIATAYRAMARKARYRPGAPSDGFGTITGRLNLQEEIRVYSRGWWAEEDTTRYDIGCPAYEDREALIWLVEAARLTCGLDRRRAAVLARMAADALDPS